MTPTRLLWAIIIGLLGAIFISIITPYVDIIINCNANAADLCDGYLPKGAMFVLLLVVLLINPMLRLIRPRLMLNTRQIALILGMALVASVVPGDGLHRRLPYHLAGTPVNANLNPGYSETYEKLNLPPSLFPDKLGYGIATPVGDHFIQELPAIDPRNPTGPKEPIPWRAWFPPLITWGSLLIAVWTMMIGLTQILLPQWQRNERLPFPLLTIQETLIEKPQNGRTLAPVFYNKAFWVGAIMAFILASMFKFNSYWPDKIPVIPLQWDLSRCFSDIPFLYLPGHIKSNYIFFIIIGVSFFMPARISFSLWFFTIVYALYQMIGQAYLPPFNGGTVGCQQQGAMLALTTAVLWLGRAHWRHVFGLLFRKPETEDDYQQRDAVIMFLIGTIAAIIWFIWVGVNPGWAIVFVGFILMISIIITRTVAETGMPYLRAMGSPEILTSIVPFSWLSPISLYFAPIMGLLFAHTSVASPMCLGAHALALDKEATPRYRWRVSLLIIAVLIFTFVICGAVHLYGNYNHSITMDGLETPLNPYWFNTFNWVLPKIDSVTRGVRPTPPPYSQIGHITAGAVLAGGLELASLNIPTWPIHPIGIIIVNTWYLNRCWVSLLIGWLLKITILRYGGSNLYRTVTPFFVGLIIGDIVHLILWGLLPAVLLFVAPSLMPS